MNSSRVRKAWMFPHRQNHWLVCCAEWCSQQLTWRSHTHPLELLPLWGSSNNLLRLSVTSCFGPISVFVCVFCSSHGIWRISQLSWWVSKTTETTVCSIKLSLSSSRPFVLVFILVVNTSAHFPRLARPHYIKTTQTNNVLVSLPGTKIKLKFINPGPSEEEQWRLTHI